MLDRLPVVNRVRFKRFTRAAVVKEGSDVNGNMAPQIRRAARQARSENQRRLTLQQLEAFA